MICIETKYKYRDEKKNRNISIELIKLNEKEN